MKSFSGADLAADLTMIQEAVQDFIVVITFTDKSVKRLPAKGKYPADAMLNVLNHKNVGGKDVEKVEVEEPKKKPKHTDPSDRHSDSDSESEFWRKKDRFDDESEDDDFSESDHSWQDKMVKNAATGNTVKVSSLPPDEQAKYRPKKSTGHEAPNAFASKAFDDLSKQHGLKGWSLHKNGKRHILKHNDSDREVDLGPKATFPKLHKTIIGLAGEQK